MRLSLAEQLAELAEPTPIDIDPEDSLLLDPSTEHVSTDEHAAREHYVNVGPSAIRKLHDSITDPKYDGVRTTRKQLLQDFGDIGSGAEDDDNTSGEEDQIRQEEEHPSQSESEEDSTHEAHQNQSLSRSESSEDEASEDESLTDGHHKSMQPELQNEDEDHSNGTDLASTLRQTREADRKKGKAVSRQIHLWDTLLDARIRMQKAVSAAHRLPSATPLSTLLQHEPVRDSLNRMLHEATSLTDELFALQESLLKTNESITPPPRKRIRLDADVDSTTDNTAYVTHLTALSSSVSALERSYHPYLVSTLAKWSAKIQAVAPTVLLPARGFKQSLVKGQSAPGVVTIIENTLRDDSTKLVARTRVARGPRTATNADGADDADPEVFDDTDFYQQLLRDVIEGRTGSGDGGEAEWIRQQRDRKARKKKVVDTKASKGRKLRYEVHEKLQNFMVPVPATSWHDEQIDELFGTLKVLERGGREDADVDTGTGVEDVIITDGFRVFG